MTDYLVEFKGEYIHPIIVGSEYIDPSLPNYAFVCFKINSGSIAIGCFSKLTHQLIHWNYSTVGVSPYWYNVKKIIYVHFAGYEDSFFNLSKKYIKKRKF